MAETQDTSGEISCEISLETSNNQTSSKKPKKKEKSKKKKLRCAFRHNKFKCKKKISLIQQGTNKCRCNKIFCDQHRMPGEHFCDFDYKIKNIEEYEKKHGLGGGNFNKISII